MQYSPHFRLLRLFLHGGLTRRRLYHQLDHSQWLSPEILQKMTLERVKRLVTYASTDVPYYQKLFKALDIHPEDIKSLQDFQHIPFLTRETVIAHRDELISRTAKRRYLHLRETGGSTGIPLRFYVDDTFWWWASAEEFIGRSWYGIHDGDKVAWIWGAQGDIRNDTFRQRLRSRIMRYRYLSAMHLTESAMHSFAEMLVCWQPDMIKAYPSAATLFAQYIQEHNIRGIHPNLIQTESERVTPAQRRFLEDTFECPVADSYSSREMAQIAFECPQGGMHIFEGCHLELVANDRPVPDGQMGEVVLTNLFNYAMPLIRYKMSDLAVASSVTCSCGRGLPLLKDIIGRKSDFVITKNGKYTEQSYFETIFAAIPQIARYQIHQPDLEHLQVNLVLMKGVNTIDFERVRRPLQETFGAQMHIDIQAVEKLKLTSSGKFRVVSSAVKTSLMR